MSQHLTPTPVAPGGAALILSLYGVTYRASGRIGDEQTFQTDFHPTYAAGFDQVVKAAVRGEDAMMTATSSRGSLSSAGGVLTIHVQI